MARKIGKVQYERLGRAVALYAAQVALKPDRSEPGGCAERAITLAFLSNVQVNLGDWLLEAGKYPPDARTMDFLQAIITDADGIPF